MSDFLQAGPFTTLHLLGGRDTSITEHQIERVSRIRPIALVLPSLVSETQGDEVPSILDALDHVHCLREIIVTLGLASKNGQDCFDALKVAASMDEKRFRLPTDTWVRVLYELAGTYHNWPMNRRRLIDLMTPLYYGRVASFINETREMTSEDAERLVEEQASFFVDAKDYLVSAWENPRQCSRTFEQQAEEISIG